MRKPIRIEFQLFISIVGTLVFCLVYVLIVTRRGSWVSEDPTFQNGSYLIENLFASSNKGQSGLLTEGFKSMVFPFGIFSEFVELFTSDSLTHFRAQLFFHISLSAIALLYLYNQFVRPQISLVLVLISFSTQAIYEQSLYSIGAAQIVLIALFVLIFGASEFPSLRMTIGLTVSMVAMSISLWANLPQLIATWACGCVICVMRLLRFGTDYKEVMRRIIVVLTISLALYSPLIYSAFQETSNYVASGQAIRLSEFRNASPLLVAQGLGKWSLLDRNWSVPLYNRDLDVSRQVIRYLGVSVVVISVIRQLKRAFPESRLARVITAIPLSAGVTWVCVQLGVSPKLLLALAVVLIAIRQVVISRSATLNRHLHGDETLFLLFSSAQIVLIASAIGWFDWYWLLRQNWRALLAFREPWAKFSQIYVVLILSCIGVVLNSVFAATNFQQTRFKRPVFWTLLVGATIYLLYPITSDPTRLQLVLGEKLSPPTIDEWRIADRLITSTEGDLAQKQLCLINFDPRNLIQSLLRTRYPLTTHVGRNCQTDKQFVKIIILNPSQALGRNAQVSLITGKCLDFESRELVIVAQGCTVQIGQNEGEVQIGIPSTLQSVGAE